MWFLPPEIRAGRDPSYDVFIVQDSHPASLESDVFMSFGDYILQFIELTEDDVRRGAWFTVYRHTSGAMVAMHEGRKISTNWTPVLTFKASLLHQDSWCIAS